MRRDSFFCLSVGWTRLVSEYSSREKLKFKRFRSNVSMRGVRRVGKRKKILRIILFWSFESDAKTDGAMGLFAHSQGRFDW